MTIACKFGLHEEVRLPELVHKDLKGTIIAIWINEDGLQYKIRYFWESKPVEVYFYEWELRKTDLPLPTPIPSGGAPGHGI